MPNAYPAAPVYTFPGTQDTPWSVTGYNIDPRLIVVDEANGNTLTRAHIRAFTRQDFEDQQLKEVGMDRIIAQTKEARMAGVRERGLMDLLLSRHAAIKTARGGGSQSIIAPFTLVPRRNMVNANYFQIEAGAANQGAGSNGIPASAWDITVNAGSSPWVKSPNNALKKLEKFFLPGNYVNIEYIDDNNVARRIVCKILSAVNADAGGIPKAKVTLEPNRTADGWSGMSADEKAVFQPTAGLVSLMANSISDYESWGHQHPAVVNLTLLEYWQQTIRSAFTYNEEYIKALQSPLTSEFFKKFRSLPLVQQRKQIEMFLEMEYYNTIFYGDEINELQTVETYTSLPMVVDPADETYPIEYKANTLGIKTQLQRNARVADRMGMPLDIDTIMEACYYIKRYREGVSGSIDRIDSITNRFDKGRIRQMMTKYYKSTFNADLTMNAQLGQKLQFNGMTVFEYDLYDLPDQGVQWAVFHDTYFDDKLAQFSASQKNCGRALWFIDWSDIVINVLKTNSAKRTTNKADELYRFVITPNEKHTLLNSRTIEVRVGDANRSLLIENYSDSCPKLTVQGCDLNG
jgi:hypothetical protein